jgi:hypothetical protein
MNRHTSDQAGAGCSVAWQLQNGRSRVQRGIAADGFRGNYPYAGVVVVAENRVSEDDSSAQIAVEAIRDIFAEGVAFGVEDVLLGSFTEAADNIRSKKQSGCSAAAIAFSGTHIWYASAGNCRIYRIDSDGVDCIAYDQSNAGEIKAPPDHTSYSRKANELKWWLGSDAAGKPVCGHSRIRQNTTYIILTAGGWIQFENNAVSIQKKAVKKTLAGWLASLSRDMKLAYRRQGGALGAVSGVVNGGGSCFPWKSWTSVTVFLGLIGYLVFANPFFTGNDTDEKTDLFFPDSAEEIVQPIPEHSAIAADSLLYSEQGLKPDIRAELPLQVAQIGGTVQELSPDSFVVCFNSEPDLQWESFSSGIYCIKGDTASTVLAQSINTLYPDLEVTEVDRIITVRENGVVECARWLSSLSPDRAASTVVVLETRSSVAGGAEWIRNYPVFANGNRAERAGEAGGFMGDSLPGLPSLRNSLCYRIVVVP